MKVKEKLATVSGVENTDGNITSNSAESLKNEQPNAKSKRDSSIELIRIVACIIVVLIHLSLNVFDEHHAQVDWSRLFEKCFLSEGVPLFYLIFGFFLCNGRSYKKIWKSTFKRVIIPVLIFVLFAQIFFMFILNKQPLSWCFKNAFINLNLQGICRTILTGDVVHINSLCAHLWYIISYLKIILWVPVLWLICKEDTNPKLARRMIIGFGMLAMVVRDIQRFAVLPVIGEIKAFKMVDLDILYVLLGYELFVHKDKIKNNKKLCILSGLAFAAINVIRYKIEMNYMVLNNFFEITGRETFTDWRYTALSFISATSLFMFLYSFDIKGEKISKAINWIADKTFGIYLIHYLLLAKIDLYKFDKIGTLVYELIYLAVGVVVIFIASLLIVCLLRVIKDLFLKGCRKLISIKSK